MKIIKKLICFLTDHPSETVRTVAGLEGIFNFYNCKRCGKMIIFGLPFKGYSADQLNTLIDRHIL